MLVVESCATRDGRGTAEPEPPTALSQYAAALAPWLADASVTELCLNRPGEVFIERASG